ncbi:spore photoproduct lyase [Clostridiaceae bacterium 14S0207]|nr:spore photoproduct lyase [Clostridiaceae bacterium 14S0207]
MFIPEKVIIEKKALEYELGNTLLKYFKENNIEVVINSSNRITGIGGKTPLEMYSKGKNTLVVGIRKDLKFQSCKPSAHYQLPLVTGCMGMCEYCYLNTQLGKRPYIKINVNIDEILNRAKQYADDRLPENTIFEGAATSDPIPVEPYTHALRKSIEFFSKSNNMKFRFVSKYDDIEGLIGIKHNNKTEVRFSINTNYIIKKFEHKTPLLEKRIAAAKKLFDDGYKIGFLIAPVFIYDNWKKEYGDLIERVGTEFKGKNITFEIISHRFTSRAKTNILDVFPQTKLPMNEEERKFKYGQFGYGKFVYENAIMNDIKTFFISQLNQYFDHNNLIYII